MGSSYPVMLQPAEALSSGHSPNFTQFTHRTDKRKSALHAKCTNREEPAVQGSRGISMGAPGHCKIGAVSNRRVRRRCEQDMTHLYDVLVAKSSAARAAVGHRHVQFRNGT